MDFEYGCSTVNKFAFLDENEVEDPSDLLTQAQTAATKKETTKGKDAKGKDAKGKKPAGKTDTKQPLKASDNAVKKTFDNKDGKKFGNNKPESDMAKENRGPRGDRPQGDRPYRPRQPRTDADGNVVESAEGEGFRGGYRGTRGGAGGNRGGYRGPRRDGEEGENQGRRFDRHSGSERTGIKAVDKKDGAGKGNWGTATDEVVIEQTLGEQPVVEGQETGKDWAERVDENEEKVPEEDAPNFMTLEEYKALKTAVNKRNDFNVRRAGEGEDQAKWGKTYLLPKKADEEDEEDEEEEESEEEEDEPEDVQKKELIKSVQSAFKFESTNPREERGGRGGRGGPRGAGDRREFGGERREFRGERRDFKKPESAAAPVEGQAADAAAPVAAEAALAAPAEERRPQGPARGQQAGRGGARGGAQQGGRGAGRQGPLKSAPKFDDEKDFPTLGK